VDRSKLHNDLVRDEGCRLAAYKDTKGMWTIGVGHLLGPDTGAAPRMSFITYEEAMALLDWDLQWAIKLVNDLFPQTEWESFSDVRYRALINMAFNRGEKNMRESTTITPAILAACQETVTDSPKWNAVSTAILTSPWGKQIGRRAERLAFMLATGKDPQ